MRLDDRRRKVMKGKPKRKRNGGKKSKEPKKMKQNQDRFGKMWLNPQYLPTYRIHCARLWILHWVFQWKTARFIYSEKRFELFKYCSKLKSVPGSSQSGFFMQTRKGRWRTWYSEKKGEFQKNWKKKDGKSHKHTANMVDKSVEKRTNRQKKIKRSSWQRCIESKNG